MYHETLGSQRDLHTTLVIIKDPSHDQVNLSESCEAILIHTLDATYSAFCGTQGHKVLFPAASGNHGNIHGKTTTGCALPVHYTFYPFCISLQTQVYTRDISQAISNYAS
jgi:hypothetical protein